MELALTRKIRVLYLDDEVNNLTAFKAGFRRQFDTYTAATVGDALRVLNEHNIHVIIADQRMPGTTGTEFFQVIRKAFPNPVRILITAYSDVDALTAAVNYGEVYRYVQKPWDLKELTYAVQSAYELYQHRHETTRKLEQLQRSNDELNRFVYSTSHDLRGPLASVLAILNLIKIEKSVDDPNNYMEMIETCMKKMDMYVQKIIEYYKSVRLDEEPEQIDFDVLLNDAIRIIHYQNEAVEFDVKVNQTEDFYGDVFRTNIVLTNLISNAVKYQRPEEKHQRVGIEATVDAKQAKVVISDNGTGILEDHLSRIFTMFFRGQYSVNGLGIGLFIVKEAINKLGGDIQVHSELGKGSIFTITLPNLVTEVAERQPQAQAEASVLV